MLGLGRALGETMAVTFVIGNANKVSSSLLAPGTTISATIAIDVGYRAQRCAAVRVLKPWIVACSHTTSCFTDVIPLTRRNLSKRSLCRKTLRSV